MDLSTLYQAILARKSVRRFAPYVAPELLLQVQAICGETVGLISENTFEAHIQAIVPDRDVTSLLGAYGRIVSPPYVIVPTLEGNHHFLVDLGFRTQQIVISLTQLGLGTCYIGTLPKDEKAREIFQIPLNRHHAAIIAFGHPAAGLSGQVANQIIRVIAGATRKLASDELYYADFRSSPEAPPPNWAPIIEAARAAPSALNAQPWRFLGRGNHLYIFCQRHNQRYGHGAGAAYKFFDTGICIANIYLALIALGIRGSWRLCTEPDENLPDYPNEFQPVAELVLGE